MIISAAQPQPFKGDFQKNIEAHLHLIGLALEKEAELIVFPELSVSGYEPSLARELATTPDDHRFDVFQDLCDTKGVTIAIGAPLIYNQEVSIGMVIFRPQLERYAYLKKYLHHTETEFFVSGGGPTNLSVNNVNTGPAICYEISVPEHQKTAAENGAEIYFAGIVEDKKGIDRTLNKMSATAQKYSMVCLMSNCVGISGNFDCAGKSSIWNREGKLVGQLNGVETGVLVYDTGSSPPSASPPRGA